MDWLLRDQPAAGGSSCKAVTELAYISYDMFKRDTGWCKFAEPNLNSYALN